MAKRFIIYCLVLNFCLPAIYSACFFDNSGPNNISSLFIKLLKDNGFDEELEDKNGEKESKPFEKEIDKDFLLCYSSLHFAIIALQKVNIDSSITLKKTSAFFEITTPPPKIS